MVTQNSRVWTPLEKEGDSNTRYNADDPGRHRAEWSEPLTNSQCWTACVEGAAVVTLSEIEGGMVVTGSRAGWGWGRVMWGVSVQWSRVFS